MAGQTAKTKKIFDARYEILSIVGRGAQSVVYHARHVGAPATEVALKVLIDQKGKNPSAERLRREALAMVSCRHRYVARLDDFHSVGSLCYLAMEYAPESDLRSFTKKHNGKLAIDQVERFLKQSVEGIAFVHRAGIIHRDIKPENILVMNEKEVRLTDFGVALLPGEECSIADLQSGVGTMNYMAPEILEGRPADPRSDLYALGVVFYELLSGTNPFAGAPLAKQIDIRKSESFPNLIEIDSSIPEYLSDLILQCMRHDPDKRFASGDELLANLLNKKSDNFSRQQKAQRQKKPARPKTNNIHKRQRKIQSKASVAANNDIFSEFDRLVAEEQASEHTHNSSEIDFSADSQANQQSANITSEQEQDFFSNPFESANQDINNDTSTANRLAEQISANPTSPNPYDGDLNEEEDLARFSEFNRKRSRSWKRPFMYILAVGCLLMFLPGLRGLLFGAVGSKISSLASSSNSEGELPVYEAEKLTFPFLAKGVYTGSVEGVLPGRSSPLTLVSFGENGKIAVLLGIEGFTPVVVDQKEIFKKDKNSAQKSLKIASNGIVLELHGEVKEGLISGYFSNLINGSQGPWSVQPAI